jgi:hypothetical protein
MRFVLLLVALLVLFALAGWITFSGDGERSSINLETNEIREDTGQAMHEGAELLHKAEQEVAPDEKLEPAENPSP